MAIFFVGYVKAVYPNGTVDVRMDGDDPEDVERYWFIEHDVHIKRCAYQAKRSNLSLDA
jgi:hypothetical protein